MRTLYRGGAVYSPDDPFATALMVDGDTVAWTGSDEAATAQAASADAVVDLQGALVTPAFVDAHVHVTETGLALGGVDVRSARSVGDVLAAVERAARAGGGRAGVGPGRGRGAPAPGPPPPPPGAHPGP